MTLQKIEAHSPEAQSADLMADNIAKLKALFPELLTETVQGGKTTASLNVEVLKGLIGDASALESDEKYGLNWHGKRRARQIALTPSNGTLRPCPEDSVDWDTNRRNLTTYVYLRTVFELNQRYRNCCRIAGKPTPADYPRRPPRPADGPNFRQPK